MSSFSTVSSSEAEATTAVPMDCILAPHLPATFTGAEKDRALDTQMETGRKETIPLAEVRARTTLKPRETILQAFLFMVEVKEVTSDGENKGTRLVTEKN